MIVNGIPLDNPALGWIFRKGSVPYTGVEATLAQVQVSGRDGSIPLPVVLSAPIWTLKVNTPPSGWEHLLALFTMPELVLTDNLRPGLEIVGRLASSTPDHVFDRNEYIDASFFVELTGVFWRSKLLPTVTQPVGAATVQVDVAPGLSGVIPDAVLRFKGAATGIRITDSSGAWVALPDTPTGHYTRFEASTGRCFLTSTNTWEGGEEVSGRTDFGGPRGNFEITPAMTPGEATARVGKLTVTTATRSGASIDVRAKAAHII